MQTHDESRRVGQAPRMGSPSAPRLRGRWLLVARSAWLVVAALCVSLFLLGLLPYAAQLHTVCPDPTAASCPNGGLGPAGVRALQDLGISVEGYVWYTVGMEVLTALVWASVGLLIFWHRSDEGMALLTALFLVIFTLILSGGPVSSLVQFSTTCTPTRCASRGIFVPPNKLLLLLCWMVIDRRCRCTCSRDLPFREHSILVWFSFLFRLISGFQLIIPCRNFSAPAH